MTAPDPTIATEIMDRLMQVVFKARDEYAARDPDGVSLNHGTVMFFGAFMAAVREWDDRQQMADAALGYSLKASALLEQLSKGKDPE